MGALDGLLVVSIDQAVAAPYAASRLADAGARVIKVERPGGDFARKYDTAAQGESAYFVWLNRGKESIELDFKQPQDAALLDAMIAKADVFIQNLAPSAMERAGFGSGELRRRHPRLITCDISGYGEDGPYRDMKAYDLLIQAETGLAGITGSPEAPGRVGVSIADIAAGMYAQSAILEALIERGRTGSGKAIKVSLFSALADWMTVPLIHHDYAGKAPERVGLNHPSLAPYGAYETRSGEPILISIQNEREWVRLCTQVLDKPALAEDPRFDGNSSRVANRAALNQEIDAVFRRLDRAEIAERLRKAKIAYGALNSVADLSVHPQLRRAEIDIPGGRTLDLPAPPGRGNGGAVAFKPVPALGEHSEKLRAEFAARAVSLKGKAG
jgi:crotonobetainyl-CoA:carnitine CoA-transferase CaiB-like acyl-CoA transferase